MYPGVFSYLLLISYNDYEISVYGIRNFLVVVDQPIFMLILGGLHGFDFHAYSFPHLGMPKVKYSQFFFFYF